MDMGTPALFLHVTRIENVLSDLRGFEQTNTLPDWEWFSLVTDLHFGDLAGVAAMLRFQNTTWFQDMLMTLAQTMHQELTDDIVERDFSLTDIQHKAHRIKVLEHLARLAGAIHSDLYELRLKESRPLPI